MTRRVRTVVAAIAIGMVPTLSAGACTTSTGARDVPDFYRAPSSVPNGPPGTIVRAEAMTPPTAESSAWRIMYTSRGENGRPIVVTGMLIAPNGTAPAGGRPVVAWAHPTTGIADRCAPSLQSQPYDSVMGLTEFLTNGWVVVATDYEGLGTEGMHPYLVGESEARSVLDSVRAAHSFGDANASTRFAVFGHSQGGQAALFTGQSAPSYAPDLQLVGVAAAAPSGDLRTQFDMERDTLAYSYIGSYMTVSWADLFGARPSTAVTPAATGQVRGLATECVVGGSKEADAELTHIFDTDPNVSPPLWVTGFTGIEPWSSLLAENSTGATRISAPTLITQGTADSVFPPSTTAALVARYRSNGTPVTEQLLDGVPHTLAGYRSVPLVVPFFTAAFG